MSMVFGSYKVSPAVLFDYSFMFDVSVSRWRDKAIGFREIVPQTFSLRQASVNLSFTFRSTHASPVFVVAPEF